MHLEELKFALCAFVGKPLVWEDAAVLLPLDDGSEIVLEYDADDDEIVLCGTVVRISRERLAACAVSLLEANLLGGETGGSAVLAYDPEHEKLVLWDRMRPSVMDVEAFRDRLSRFYLVNRHWSERMQSELLDKAEKEPFRFLTRMRG